MKKLFSMVFWATALVVGLSLVACGGDEPESNISKAPEIKTKVTDDYVTIEAVGEGDVKLYFAQDLKDPIENPTTYLRSFKDFPVNLCATAQQPGKEVSQPTYATVTVPFAEVPKVVDVWSDPVVKDKPYIHYHINLFQDSSEIFLHNVTFTIGDSESPAMNVLIKAPAEFNKDNRTYYLRGTDIIPFLLRGNTRVPVASMPVTNFDCYVDVKEMTYSISFDCHGGQYSNAGKLTTTIPIEVVADVN